MSTEINDLAPRLEKKATFEAATKGLREVVAGGAVSAESIFPSVQRVFTLLRTRYSNVAFWAAGNSLFMACQQMLFVSAHRLKSHASEKVSFSLEVDQKEKLKQFLAAARDMLQSSDGPPPSSLSLKADQKEKLKQFLAAARDMLQLNDGYLRDDSGNIVEDGEREREQQQREQGEAQAGQPSRAQLQLELQAQILQSMQEVYSGYSETVARNNAAMEEEMQRVIEIIRAQQGGTVAQARPPASKRLLASLPREEITEKKLCAVCTCELEVGEQELPTDDPKYEAAKEKKAEEEEERRGAANANSGGEFMYR
eukprot:gene18876-25434_t